jgi:hypothetical protein
MTDKPQTPDLTISRPQTAKPPLWRFENRKTDPEWRAMWSVEPSTRHLGAAESVDQTFLYMHDLSGNMCLWRVRAVPIGAGVCVQIQGRDGLMNRSLGLCSFTHQ